MAKHCTARSLALLAVIYLELLLVAMKGTNSARILDEASPAPATADAPQPSDPALTPTALVPPASTTPAVSPQPPLQASGNDHPLTFFMHDILGGSNPSARIVTGLVANSAVIGQLPFSRPNKDIFPINGALPLPSNVVDGILNSNTIPMVAGLGGTTTSIVQNNANIPNSAANNLPFVNAGNLPIGTTLQSLLFGTTTVIDDELTEGQEIGSAVIGRAQGFYVASSQDGTSQSIALTVMLEGGDHADTISFFGVHRTAAAESHVAILGGTGKYENAKGYAAIQTLHAVNQHTTDGVETLLQFSVYLS